MMYLHRFRHCRMRQLYLWPLLIGKTPYGGYVRLSMWYGLRWEKHPDFSVRMGYVSSVSIFGYHFSWIKP